MKRTHKFPPPLPLVARYIKRVNKLPKKIHQELQHTIGITWNLRGKTFVPLGRAAMLVQSTHPSDTNRLGVTIEQACFNAQVDPRNGEIHYSNRRMSHDFAIVPYPGARGRVLDPREKTENRGEFANADWVRLGIDVHQVRVRACNANWRLDVIPQLPRFWAGFESINAVEMEVTDALMEDIAGHLQVPLTKVQAMDKSELVLLAKAHWPCLWKAPNTPGNETQYWLIEAKYLTKLDRAFMFEDFSELVGVDTWNPAKTITGAVFSNQTRAIAEALNIKLAQLIDVLNTETEQSGDSNVDEAYDEKIDQAMSDLEKLRNGLRESLGVYASLYTDEALTVAVMNPDEQFEIMLKDLQIEDVLTLMRIKLKESNPLLAEVVTDDELKAAVVNPEASLHVGAACRIQVLFRDTRRPPEDSMNFSFGDRVFADLWQPTLGKSRQFRKTGEAKSNVVLETVPANPGS